MKKFIARRVSELTHGGVGSIWVIQEGELDGSKNVGRQVVPELDQSISAIASIVFG